MSIFEFATATKIIFGAGSIDQLPKLASAFGNQVFLVTGGALKRVESILSKLAEAHLEVHIFQVTGEPDIALAQDGVQRAREFGAQVVVSIGGGSVLDTGKAIAALVTNQGDPLDYLEVIGKGQPLKQPALPFIAIPTTAGTGSEVTSNAVLSSKEHAVKVSLRSPLMLPRIALVDPTLTYGMPPEITAQTGMDALTQVIEPFVSNKSNPITDALCAVGIQHAGQALVRAYHHPEDTDAREAMALTSLLGGLALANAKLGAVHGFAGPMGGMFDAPHGALCASLLAPVTQVNIQALQERAPDSPILERYLQVDRWLGGEGNLENLIQTLRSITRELEIPRLSRYEVTEADFDAIVEKATVASSMQGNPIKLTTAELTQILQLAL